jgi:2-polyprenyl-6-methoxyphenol hydroxylase-like FAD-dependent oxidoreductase
MDAAALCAHLTKTRQGSLTLRQSISTYEQETRERGFKAVKLSKMNAEETHSQSDLRLYLGNVAFRLANRRPWLRTRLFQDIM